MRDDNFIFRERAEAKTIAFHCEFQQFRQMQRMPIGKLRDLFTAAEPICNDWRAQSGAPNRRKYGVFSHLN